MPENEGYQGQVLANGLWQYTRDPRKFGLEAAEASVRLFFVCIVLLLYRRDISLKVVNHG